jgi:tetratricopeptide (TPR) repeat protein
MALFLCFTSQAASVSEGWRLYQRGEYQAALAEYQGALAKNPNDLNALYGTVNSLTVLHRYGEARDYCQRLKTLNAPPEVIKQKKEWIEEVYSANHQFGLSVDAGPLFYSKDYIKESDFRYTYDKGQFGEGEAWFTWNQKHTFSVSASQFKATFKPDTVYLPVVYLDTLYQSLNQTPRTDQFIKGQYTIQGTAITDTFYSDYIVPTTMVTPPRVYQNQVRLGWSGLYLKGALSAGLTVGQSNIKSQKKLQNLWLGQTYYLPWLNLSLGENVQRLDHLALLQLTPKVSRGLGAFLFDLELTSITRIKNDSLIPIPSQQISETARLTYDRWIWSGSLSGAWGHKAFIATEEGRTLSSITQAHKQSYSASLGWRPLASLNYKIYAIYKWEQYAQVSRNLGLLGMMYQW